MTDWSSLSGFASSSSGTLPSRSRSIVSGEVKLHATTSYSPRSRSTSSTRRRRRCASVSSPTAPSRAGSVVGSLSRP